MDRDPPAKETEPQRQREMTNLRELGAAGTERERTASIPGKTELIYTERQRQGQLRETARIRHREKTGGGTEAEAVTGTGNHTHTHTLLERAPQRDGNKQKRRIENKVQQVT